MKVFLHYLTAFKCCYWKVQWLSILSFVIFLCLFFFFLILSLSHAIIFYKSWVPGSFSYLSPSVIHLFGFYSIFKSFPHLCIPSLLLHFYYQIFIYQKFFISNYSSLPIFASWMQSLLFFLPIDIKLWVFCYWKHFFFLLLVFSLFVLCLSLFWSVFLIEGFLQLSGSPHLPICI